MGHEMDNKNKNNLKKSYDLSDESISDIYFSEEKEQEEEEQEEEQEEEKTVETEISPTANRINFVKNVVENAIKNSSLKSLKCMIDFDNCNTETSCSKLSKSIIDAKKVWKSLDVDLVYVKSGTTGHTFRAVSRKNPEISYAVKVCAYPKDIQYGGINNKNRPENVELRILKLLGQFVANQSTPHIILPMATFNTSITNFIKIPKHIVDLEDSSNALYANFIERYDKDEFEDYVSVLISEWCNGGDLLDFIRKNYKTMTVRVWRTIFLQLLITLASIQKKYPQFRHNDMKANNILVRLSPGSSNKMYGYDIENVTFVLPNIGIQIGLWDYDFSCVGDFIKNNKVNSEWAAEKKITSQQNRYYDIHFFFNTLMLEKFFPEFYKGGAPQEVIDFVHRIVPEQFRTKTKISPKGKVHTIKSKYVSERGRILVDKEYATPLKIIMEDEFFSKYRHQKSRN